MKQMILLAIVVIISAASWFVLLGNPNTTVAPVVIDDNVTDVATDTPEPSTSNPTFSENNLSGTMWEWQETLYNNGSIVAPDEPSSFVLTFSSDGGFTATTDCNTLNGQFSVTTSTITFTDIASTRMACLDGTLESAFTDMLTQTQGYLMTDTGQLALMLQYDSGSVLFDPVRPTTDEEIPNQPVDPNVMIGMTLEQAQTFADENDLMFRVGSIDGEPQAVTMDYRPGRITAETQDDVIVGYTVE